MHILGVWWSDSTVWRYYSEVFYYTCIFTWHFWLMIIFIKGIFLNSAAAVCEPHKKTVLDGFLQEFVS